MKKWIVIVVVLTLIFTVLATRNTSPKGKERIVICASSEEFRNEELQRQLNEQFPQYEVVVNYMSTGKAAAKLYAEGVDTEVDIILAMETGYLNKLRNNLADISGYSRIPYLEGMTPADNNNLWVTWERFAGCIIVNRQVLEKHGLEAPKTYEDLLKPEYQGLIAMPNPKSSSTGYFYYMDWVNQWGLDGALEYVDKLHKNLKQFTESGSGPIKMLKQGEIAIGLGMTFQAVVERNDGQPFEIIIPETGSPYSLTGTTIIKGRESKEGVSQVFDFLVNNFMVYDKENYSPETVYAGQISRVKDYPEGVKYANMTDIDNEKRKEELLDAWKY